MSYKKIKAASVPKRTRKVTPRFETTEEWRMMKADLDRGLKPGEALQVVFTERDKEEYDIRSRRTIARFVKKYLLSKDLPHTVKSFERRESGDFYIIVEHAAHR